MHIYYVYTPALCDCVVVIHKAWHWAEDCGCPAWETFWSHFRHVIWGGNLLTAEGLSSPRDAISLSKSAVCIKAEAC